MKKLKPFGIRILISIAAGCFVAVIAFTAAWLPMRFMPNFGPKVLATGHALTEVQQLINDYQWDANSLPRSLAEIRPLYHGDDRLKWDEQSHPLDAWGRPLLYAVEGPDFVLSSLGRDGKPGGIGLDADLVLGRGESKEFQVPFHQFLLHKPARGVVLTCLVCGVVVFFVAMITVDPSRLQNKGAAAILVKLAVTVIGAVIASLFMTALHIPNHH